MIITVDIKKENVEEFYRMLKEHDWIEEQVKPSFLDSHLDEALRREQDPVLSQAEPWSLARQKYVGKGL
jgi:hemerythrin superfamily protein